MNKKLTYVKTYMQCSAVYLNDSLLYYGEIGWEWPVTKALGYTREGIDINVWPVPPEFETDAYGKFSPPTTLCDFKQRYARWRTRLHQERIESLRKELAELESISVPLQPKQS